MDKEYLFRSTRIGFRNWIEEDLKPFIDMNASDKVMHYFPTTLSGEETKLVYDRIQRHFQKHEYGFYAVDDISTGKWMGFIGFQHVRFEASFSPAIEIGYRLLPQYWGKGIGTEGGLACLKYAKEHLDFDQVVSFTARVNLPSQHVMEKIGLIFRYEFDHPLVRKDDPLRKHVLYQKTLKK
jgi:ribosomal-protein-alanine N-acetyltransferase